MKILIAEDDPVTRRMLARTLESWGYEVLQAIDGVEARKLLETESVDMILTDWMMPGMDGPQLCRRIRELAEGQYVYIILLTSRSDKESLVEGLAAGADDFVAKPFEREELRARLRAGGRILALQDELHARIGQLAELNETIARSNRRMKDDLEAAAATQRALLPADLPQLAEATFAWQYHPCTELGGDCLNVFRVDRQYVAMYVLDVSGHGVQAALLSVTLSRILSPLRAAPSILTRQVDDSPVPQIVPPVEVAELLNRRFPLDVETGQYFTLLYGLLNSETGEFRYVTAGQPGPIHLPHEARPEILEGYDLPVGFCGEPGYREHGITLQPKDRLYMFTDGIIEATSPRNEQFGDRGLCGVLEQNREAPLADGLSSLLESVESWCGNANPSDDIAVLAVEMAAETAVTVKASGEPVACSVVSR